MVDTGKKKKRMLFGAKKEVPMKHFNFNRSTEFDNHILALKSAFQTENRSQLLRILILKVYNDEKLLEKFKYYLKNSYSNVENGKDWASKQTTQIYLSDEAHDAMNHLCKVIPDPGYSLTNSDLVRGIVSFFNHTVVSDIKNKAKPILEKLDSLGIIVDEYDISDTRFIVYLDYENYIKK